MLKLRWKWIGYHVYGNLLACLLCILIALVVFPSTIWDQLTIGAILRYLLITAFASVVLGIICGFNFSRNLRNRLEEVTVGAKNLAYGNLQYRLAFTEDRELGDIALSFNEMARRLDDQVGALQKLADENDKLVQQTKATAVTEERQRLARELHDAVSQQLFAISMTAATASRVVNKDPIKCDALISNIEQSAAKAQAEMRALLLQLRPVTLENERLHEAVTSLANELQSKQALSCEVKLMDLDLPSNIENQLYRVVQEGLSNVIRHAEASKVTIYLRMNEAQTRVQLDIEDDGQGFATDSVSKTSYGLNSIRERISSLGGTVEWLSVPDKGTKMQVRIPLMRS